MLPWKLWNYTFIRDRLCKRSLSSSCCASGQHRSFHFFFFFFHNYTNIRSKYLKCVCTLFLSICRNIHLFTDIWIEIYIYYYRKRSLLDKSNKNHYRRLATAKVQNQYSDTLRYFFITYTRICTRPGQLPTMIVKEDENRNIYIKSYVIVVCMVLRLATSFSFYISAAMEYKCEYKYIYIYYWLNSITG